MIPGIVASSGKRSPWHLISGPFAQTGTLDSSDGILRLIGLGAPGSSYWESTDKGVSWTGIALSFPNSAGAMTVTTNRVVVTGQSGLRVRWKSRSAGGAFTTISPEPLANAIGRGMAYSGSRLVMAANSNPFTMYRSDNEGTSWSSSTTGIVTNDTLGDAIYVGGYFYAPVYGGGFFYVSADGITWTRGTIPATWSGGVVGGLGSFNGQPYWASPSGDIFTSAAGATSMTLLASGTPLRGPLKQFGTTAYARGLTGYVVSTTDVSAWNTYPQLPSGKQVFDLTVLDDVIYAGSSTGEIYTIPV